MSDELFAINCLTKAYNNISIKKPVIENSTKTYISGKLVFSVFFQFIFRALSLLSAWQMLNLSTISITYQKYWDFQCFIFKLLTKLFLFFDMLFQILDSGKVYCSIGSTSRILGTKYLDNTVKKYDLRSHSKYILWIILAQSVWRNVKAKFWLLNLFVYHIYHKNAQWIHQKTSERQYSI